MTDQRTIADSKRAFHTAFPYVIPSLYRRTADELLVELHLLSHQQHFKSDAFFAVGLRQVFTAFTQGYKPEKHLDELYAAICSCNGFNPEALKQLAEGSTSAVSGHTVSEVREWLSNRGAGAPVADWGSEKRFAFTDHHCLSPRWRKEIDCGSAVRYPEPLEELEEKKKGALGRG